MEKKSYGSFEDVTGSSLDDLRRAEPNTQISLMKDWFFSNFEDPVNSSPYITSEGGYIFIYGGPYDAEEVLQEEFEGVVRQDVIQSLVDELLEICVEWSGTPSWFDYEHQLAEAALERTDYLQSFNVAMRTNELLLQSHVDSTVQKDLLRLLHVHVITSLETYLADAFIQTTLTDEAKLRKLIETTPTFRNQQFPLSSIYAKMSMIKKIAIGYLSHLLWHNLKVVTALYETVLEIKVTADLDYLKKAVRERHDIVHRGGFTKDKQMVNVTPDSVKMLVEHATFLVTEIDDQLRSAAGKHEK